MRLLEWQRWQQVIFAKVLVSSHDLIFYIYYFIGGKARLDGCGVLFLRSLCRLTHVGHAQYYKGDGHAFHDYLEEHYPGSNSLIYSSCIWFQHGLRVLHA